MKRLIFILVFSLISLPSHAVKKHPFGASFEQEISQYTTREGLTKFGNTIERTRREIIGPRHEINDKTPSVLVSKYRRKGLSGSILLAKVNEHELTLLLDLVDQEYQKALSAKTLGETKNHIGRAIRLINTIQIEGQPIGPVLIKNFIKMGLSEWVIPKQSEASAEAANLLDPLTGEYLDSLDISDLQSRGEDLSEYFPPSSSHWHSQPDISKLKIKDVLNGQTHPLYQNSGFKFPDKFEFKYEDMIQSQTKPKMEVSLKDSNGKKWKFKLKMGAEMHADPTANVLMLAAGFPADLSVYQRNIRINLGKSSYSDLVRSWEDYYKRGGLKGSYQIEESVTEHGVDKNGQEYVIIKEAVVEGRARSVERVGPWPFSDFSEAREVRGLILFQTWIANLDMKELDNNRLTLRMESGKTPQVYRMISDPGAAFGNYMALLKEKPELFKNNLIKRDTPREVALNIFTFRTPSTKEHISFADAKWATRLIAQFKRSQIEDAVEVGGWPKCLGKLITDKLISRRNSLVKAFGLSSEFKELKLREDLGPDNIQLCLNTQRVTQNFTTDFDFSKHVFLEPLQRALVSGLKHGTSSSITGVNKIRLTGDELSLDPSLVTQLLINIDRQVEKNPNSQGIHDQYLVKDSLGMGFQLGVAFGAFVESEVWREYELVYPVRSKKDGHNAGGFIVNFLLAKDIKNGTLPENYVLSTTHSLAHRAGARMDNRSASLSPGIEVSAGKEILWRSILDHRNPDKALLFRERLNENQGRFSAYLRLLRHRWHFLETFSGWGENRGVGYILERQDLQDKDFSEKINFAVQTGNFRPIDDAKLSFSFTGNSTRSRFDLGLLIYHNNSFQNVDHFIIQSDSVKHDVLQLEAGKKKGNSIPFISESTEHRLQIFSESPDVLRPTYSIDSVFTISDGNTKSKELEKSYLKSLNGSSRSGLPLIDFSPSQYSYNGLWSSTVSSIRLRVYDSGIQKLIRIKNNDFWNVLAQQMSMSRKVLDKRVATPRGIREERYFKAVLKFIKGLNETKMADSKLQRTLSLSKLMKSLFYNSGRNTGLVRFLLQFLNSSDYYLEVSVGPAQGKETDFIEEVPLWGAEGTMRPIQSRYLTHFVHTPTDLYFMLDNWYTALNRHL